MLYVFALLQAIYLTTYLLIDSQPSDLQLLFFFNYTATTEIYTLSLHDALPIYSGVKSICAAALSIVINPPGSAPGRSEEHTSELQSQSNLVCRLLLEKKKDHTMSDRMHNLVLQHQCRRMYYLSLPINLAIVVHS